MKNSILEFNTVPEATTVLQAMINSNKSILKKDYSLYEDYNILVKSKSCTLEYKITSKQDLV